MRRFMTFAVACVLALAVVPSAQQPDAVKAAAANAVSQGFLLQADADTLITAAQASNVLNP